MIMLIRTCRIIIEFHGNIMSVFFSEVYKEKTFYLCLQVKEQLWLITA